MINLYFDLNLRWNNIVTDEGIRGLIYFNIIFSLYQFYLDYVLQLSIFALMINVFLSSETETIS